MKRMLAGLITTFLAVTPAFAQDPLPGISDLGSVPEEEPVTGFWLGIGGGYWEDRATDESQGFISAIFMFDAIPMLNVYASIGLASEEYDILGISIDVYQYPFDLGVRLYPLGEGWIRPYIDASIGWYYVTVEAPDIDFNETENVFGYKAGLGVEFEVADGIILDFYTAWRFLEDTSSSSSSGDIDTSSDRFDIGVGIIFQVG